jgi:hypothetical protein
VDTVCCAGYGPSLPQPETIEPGLWAQTDLVQTPKVLSGTSGRASVSYLSMAVVAVYSVGLLQDFNKRVSVL